MAWLAVNKDCSETIFSCRPLRGYSAWCEDCSKFDDSYVYLPEGTIEKILDRKITWADEPVLI